MRIIALRLEVCRVLITSRRAVGAVLLMGAILLFGLGALAEARPVGILSRQAPALPTPAAGACVAAGEKSATNRVALGSPAGVTLSLRTACGAITAPLHVALVMDGSAAMISGTLKTDQKNAAQTIVRGLDLPANDLTQVAVVEFNDHARRLIDLSNDEAAVLAAVQRVEAKGKTMIEVGIDEGVKAIEGGRGAAKVNEVIIVMTNGRNEKGCSAAVSAADKAKSKSILMMSMCIAADCDNLCVQSLATSVRRFYWRDDVEKLVQDLRRLQTRVAVTINKLVVSDRLPPNIQLVPGSAAPPPRSISPAGDVLVWESDQLPADGVTLTYRVVPQELGRHPANVEAVAMFTNTVGWTGSFAFAVPVIEVVTPPTPGHTPPPTATATHLPPPTTTATPSPVPSAPTESPRRAIYLPSLWRNVAPDNGTFAATALVVRWRAGR
jgi:hypothetical protein